MEADIKMGNEKKLISVIIPIYKVEKYLDKCIQSVINQTYSNLEIILVDDGSPDNCPEMCDKWAAKDERIKVIHKKNGGLSDARNTGLDIATGDYIAFVDSDDYIEADMYECLFNQLVNTKSQMAICNLEYVDVEGNITTLNTMGQDGCFSSRQILGDWCGSDFVYYVVVWNKLYSRSCWKNIRFPVGKVHEDNFVMYKLFFNCEYIVCLKAKKYNYVQRKDSIMSAKISPKRLNSVEAFCEMFRFYLENGLSDISYNVVSRLGQLFFDINGRINIFTCTDEERKYIKDTKKVFYDIYFGEASQKKIKNYIKYYFPYVLRIIKKIVKCCKYALIALKYSLLIEKKTVLIDTPTHGNLGDHAIVISQKQILRKNNISTQELSADALDNKEYLFAKLTPKNKCIIIPGGGFLGTLWPKEEERVRRIVNCFKSNKIIVFPQTVSYDLKSESGRKYLKQAQKIYSEHPNLMMFVREKQSYEFMQKYFPSVKSVLVPDIVTLLDINIVEQKRKDILFCMRDDLEKKVTDEQLVEIQKILKKTYPNEQIKNIDTVVPYMVTERKRRKEVTYKLEQFKKAKLIITDRLHGMIFATITATPCIAFGNSNGKVKNMYDWLKYNEYIKYVDDIEDFKSIVNILDIERKYSYDKTILKDAFEPLLAEIEAIN